MVCGSRGSDDYDDIVNVQDARCNWMTTVDLLLVLLSLVVGRGMQCACGLLCVCVCMEGA